MVAFRCSSTELPVQVNLKLPISCLCPLVLGLEKPFIALLALWDVVMLLFYFNVLFKTFSKSENSPNTQTGSLGFLCKLTIRILGQNPQNFDDFKILNDNWEEGKKKKKKKTGFLRALSWHTLD